jgi:hypothetical protein
MNLKPLNISKVFKKNQFWEFFKSHKLFWVGMSSVEWLGALNHQDC